MGQEMKKKFNYIAVVLVYRNADDLEECILSMNNKLTSLKIIIVNAFYDEKSYNIIKKIAIENDCEFINIENKGYSYGNNVGIEFALKEYDFNYIIISNPDITIEKWSEISNDKKVIAPQIIAADGKRQNPMTALRNRFSEWLIYVGFKRNIMPIVWAGIGINKLVKTMYMFMNRKKDSYRVYAAHGSFIIIAKEVIEKITPLYDEKMFLFAEENVLAKKLYDYNINTYYSNTIIINHKEDGSMSLSDISLGGELKKSNIYYYEKYVRMK